MTPLEVREARRREIEMGVGAAWRSGSGTRSRATSPMAESRREKRGSVAFERAVAMGTEEGKGSGGEDKSVREGEKGKEDGLRGGKEKEIEEAGKGNGDGKEVEKDGEVDDEEDEIVMSSTSYPGQEWRPEMEYGGWEGD